MALNFTRRVNIQGADGRPVLSTITVPGHGSVKSSPDRKRYEDLQLREADARTIIWTTDVYLQAQEPAPGDTCQLEGKTWTVKAVFPLNPDGAGIVKADVVVSI